MSDLPNCPACGGQLEERELKVKTKVKMKTCKDCGKPFVGDVERKPKPIPLHEQVADPDPDGIDAFVPDFMEVQIGWRAWGIDTNVPPGEFPYLKSVSHSTVWIPGEAVEAECGSCDEIPGERHGCGLYSAKTFEHLQSMHYHYYDAERGQQYSVVGEVSVWGKVVEGTSGWRSQYGYPRQLWVPFEAWRFAKPLREAYMVPVRLRNILDEGVKKL
jgi:hypothetical protein